MQVQAFQFSLAGAPKNCALFCSGTIASSLQIRFHAAWSNLDVVSGTLPSRQVPKKIAPFFALEPSLAACKCDFMLPGLIWMSFRALYLPSAPKNCALFCSGTIAGSLQMRFHAVWSNLDVVSGTLPSHPKKLRPFLLWNHRLQAANAISCCLI